MSHWPIPINQIARDGRHEPRRPLIERVAVVAPADLDEQLARIRPYPGWIRVPLIIAVAAGLWAAIIVAAIAIFHHL